MNRGRRSNQARLRRRRRWLPCIHHVGAGSCGNEFVSQQIVNDRAVVTGFELGMGDKEAENGVPEFLMAELHAEGDRMIGDDIAEEGIKYLMTLNGGKSLTTPSALLAAE